MMKADKVSFGCRFVLCVTSGEGFEKGKIYPLLGTKHGIHILRECHYDNCTETDPFDFVACPGGIGDGIFNNWDDSGAPSFEELTISAAKYQITYMGEVVDEGDL